MRRQRRAETCACIAEAAFEAVSKESGEVRTHLAGTLPQVSLSLSLSLALSLSLSRTLSLSLSLQVAASGPTARRLLVRGF